MTAYDDLVALITDLENAEANMASTIVALRAQIAADHPTPTPTPTPTPVPVRSPAQDLLGFYPGFASVSGLTALEAFLGRQVPYVVQFSDADPTKFTGSIWGQVVDAGKFQTLANRLTLVEAMPLCFSGRQDSTTVAGRAAIGTGLLATAQGTNDTMYRAAFNYLKGAGYPDAIIRLGWEFDGGWMPWSSIGNEQVWVDAWRHVVMLARSISPQFRFDWNGDPGKTMLPANVYPGDAYVDIIGLDVYDKGQATDRSWLAPNLAAHQAFALEHGKQVSYPEWGLTGNVPNSGGDNPAFIDLMADTMEACPTSGAGSLAYHSYFNSDEPDGWHALSHFPLASARLLARFA